MSGGMALIATTAGRAAMMAGSQRSNVSIPAPGALNAASLSPHAMAGLSLRTRPDQ